MKALHIPSNKSTQSSISPANAELAWLDCRFLSILPGEQIDFGGDDHEWVADILTGTCNINIHHQSEITRFEKVGDRSSEFDGPPTMVYSPRNARVTLIAGEQPVEVLMMGAPARRDTLPRCIRPEDGITKIIGKDNWQRTVHTSIGDNVDADRLIIGETVNPPGNWSSAPPHKHDSNGESEIPMEEVYFYRFEPVRGYGLQRVYTAPGAEEPLDEVYAVKHNDFVALPRGYHPVVVGPGYRMMYVWALAGNERKYGAWSDDPEHAWIKE